jgi:hypothetical protein
MRKNCGTESEGLLGHNLQADRGHQREQRVRQGHEEPGFWRIFTHFQAVLRQSLAVMALSKLPRGSATFWRKIERRKLKMRKMRIDRLDFDQVFRPALWFCADLYIFGQTCAKTEGGRLSHKGFLLCHNLLGDRAVEGRLTDRLTDRLTKGLVLRIFRLL